MGREFESFPVVVGWELTLACNLRCLHCGSSAGLPRESELSLAESLEICAQLPDLLVQEVNFTGGEPLLSPHWFEIATNLAGLGIRTKILSNGLTLDRQTIAKVKDAGICAVGISLDGLEPTHDKIRNQRGLFHKVMKAFELIHDANLPLTVITTVTSWNVTQLPELCQLLIAAGISEWQIQPIFPLGRALNQTDQLTMSEEQYVLMGDFFQRWSPEAARSGLSIAPGDSFGYFSKWDDRTPPWMGCPAGFLSCGITSDGKVKGCLSLPEEFVEGDLRQNDFWDIWFNPQSFAFTRHYKSNQLGEFCSTCQVAEQCKGGCSAMSIGSTGRFHSDPFCFRGIADRAENRHSYSCSYFVNHHQE